MNNGTFHRRLPKQSTGQLTTIATILFIPPLFFAAALTLLLASPSFCCAANDLPKVSPETVGMDSEHLDRIDELVEEAIQQNQMPGCVVMVNHKGRTVFLEAYGHRQLQPSKLLMTVDTVFDMASLTKPIATGTSIMLLVERGRIRIAEKYGRYAPEFNVNEKDLVTVFQMLTHQAGFIPDNSIKDYTDREQIWPNLFNLGLKYEPTAKFVYSDVGFQMLGKLVEIRSGLSLNEFSRQNIFEPLGMSETGYLPAEPLRQRAATTEQREDRWMQGEVHDPRAFAMGGVAGHAGLFSTARDLAKYAQMILNEGKYAGTRVMSTQTVRRMTEPHEVAGARRALGWDVRSGYSSNRGELMSDQAFGHGGFTGTAMWIDPKLQLSVIFSFQPSSSERKRARESSCRSHR